MLEAIRKRSGGIVVKVLLVFLVMSFGAWGVGDYIRGGVGGNSVASVGDVDISPQAFSNEMQREMQRLRGLLGDQLDADMARQIGLPDQVLSRMVRSALYLSAANEQGIIIDDAQVTAQIQSISAFKGVTGQFDKDAFRMAIGNAGYSEQSFIRLVRDDLKRSALINSFDGGAVGSQYIADLIHAYRGETRSVEFAVIPDARFTDVLAPDNAAIAAYHNDNQNQFMAPEYRSLSYIFITASDFAQVSDVTEEDILEAYEMRKAEFISQGSRQILQAIYSDEATAIKAVDMISKGRDFAETAGEIAGASAESLDLGWVTRDDMLGEALADAVFSTSAGSVSQPAQSMLGWHVFKVLDVKEKAVSSLGDVRGDLAEDIALSKAVDTLYEQANALEDELGSGATLEEASLALGLTLKHIEGVDKGGLDHTGVMTRDLPDEALIAQAFSTEEGTESPLIESKGNAYYIVRVDGVDAPALRPLDTVRDAVSEAILKDMRQEQAKKSTQQVVENMNGASTLAATVFSTVGEGIAINVAANFKRNGAGIPANMPKELAALMFEKKTGEAGMVRGADGYVVAHMRSIAKADTANSMETVNQIKVELAEGMRSDIFEQIARALEQRMSVTVNRNVLNQAF